MDARLILHPDVRITPVGELSSDLRRMTGDPDTGCVVTRLRSRTPSVIVDDGAADLLRRFSRPTTIADAVVAHGGAIGRRPLELMDDVRDLLRRVLAKRILVLADGDETAPVEPDFAAGDRVRAAVVRCPLQVLSDSAVYVVLYDGAPAALKIRRGAGPDDVRLIDREAAALRRVNGGVAPRLLDRGSVDGRPYLVTEWIAGVDPETAARGERRDRRALLRLVKAIAGAYAALHRSGVVHGDVHPRNTLVDRDGTVRLIDFGYAAFGGPEGARPLRGGVSFFLTPEDARAQLAGSGLPRRTERGEQYAVGALLYRVLTGTHYCDFQLERDVMLRQIVDAPPLSFAARGLDPWPEVESVLERALAKQASHRYADLATLAAALPSVPEKASPRRTPGPARALARIRRRLLAEAGLDGHWLRDPLPPPSASVSHGAAGIAWALRRVAMQTEDAELLSLAELWVERSIRASTEAGAFDRRGGRAEPEGGTRSPHHSLAGVHLVDALVAHAAADSTRHRAAAERFVEASESSTSSLDPTFGLASTLVGATLLFDTLEPGCDALGLLRTSGEAASRRLWMALGRLPSIGDAEISSPGAAHGWAGYLYATLLWWTRHGGALPAGVESRLEQLAALAEPAGRGLRWPWILQSPQGSFDNAMAGWCNGSAGYVFLWCLAGRALGIQRFLDVAERAGWDVWDDSSAAGSLCCGLVGRSYALLHLHKTLGENAWRERGRDLATRAAEHGRFDGDYRHSLFKGELALAVLEADLGRVKESAFPLVEPEGWSSPACPSSI